MAYEIYRSNRSISGQTSNVLANYDVRTGGREVARAISGAGSVLTNLGEKWDLQQADTQFTKAKAQAREEHNRFLISLEAIDPDDYDKAYEQSLENRQALTPKNKRAARVYNNWLTTLSPFWNDDKNKYMKARIDDDFRAVGYEERQRYIETGDGREYFVHLAKGAKLGAYSREESAKYKQYAIDDRERYARTQSALTEQKAEEELELQREEDRDKISKLIRSGEQADSAIESSNLDEKEQFSWFERQRMAIERRAKGEPIETDQRAKGALETMAYRIDDSGKIKDFREALNKARYDDYTIDEGTYDELYSLSERKFDAHRDSEMAERMMSFTKQLLTIPSKDTEGFTALIKGKSDEEILEINEHRQLESDNLDRCRAAIRQWLTENPEADAVEIRKQGKIFEALYKKTPQQLKQDQVDRIADAKEREAKQRKLEQAFTRGFNQAISGQIQKSPYEEYPDAFLEDGIWKVIRDGKKYRIED